MNNVRGWIRHNITENPMLAEIERFRRKFFSFRGPNVQANGGLGLIIVLFLLYTVICVYNRGDIEPITQLLVFLTFALFAIPLMLHATIAGERERRSWDMLLVAPITNSQIIIGKLIGAFLGLSLAFAIFMVPVVILACFYAHTNWLLLVLGVVVIISQLLSLISLTILISARVRRPLVSLAVTIGAVMVIFIFVPLFGGILSSVNFNFIASAIYPYSVIAVLARHQARLSGDEYFRGEEVDLNPFLVTTTNLVLQAVLTTVLLVWAIKTLNFADNEVKFLKRKKNNA